MAAVDAHEANEAVTTVSGEDTPTFDPPTGTRHHWVVAPIGGDAVDQIRSRADTAGPQEPDAEHRTGASERDGLELALPGHGMGSPIGLRALAGHPVTTIEGYSLTLVAWHR